MPDNQRFSSDFDAQMLIDELDDIRSYAKDVERSHYSNFVNNVQRFMNLFVAGTAIKHVVDSRLPKVDFKTWYQDAQKTVGSFVGSGRLDWPPDMGKRVALQFQFFQAVAAEELNPMDFALHFLYAGSGYQENLDNIVDQLFRPFVRDLMKLFERYARDAEQTKPKPVPIPVGRIAPMKKEPEKDQAFVMMSISEDRPELEDVLNSIDRACQTIGIPAVRADKVEHSGKITDLILEHLRTSRHLVSDVTDERPNVYYELGYAHGYGKEVILVAKKGSTLHFDIKDYNVIFYKNLADLEQKLTARLKTSRE